LSSSRLARVAAVRFALGLLCMALVKPPSLNPQTSPQGKSVAVQTALIPFDLYDFDAKCPNDAAAGHCAPAVQDGGGVKVGDMVQGPQGDDSFYGATPGGGKHGWGTIFKITTTKGASEDTSGANVQVLYSFGDAGLTDGRNPSGGLTLGSDGNLYGVTYAGGVKNVGTIFRMARSAGTPQILYSFCNGVPNPPAKGQPPPPPLTPQQIDDLSPSYPISPPILGSDGNLYGVTPSSNPAGGALYQLSSAGVLKCLHRFKGGQEAAAYGLYPRTLNQGSRGVFYGTTMQGGLGAGTVFQFNGASAAATGGITTIYKFAANGSDGTFPNGVLLCADGNLYGTTYSGGPGVRGVVFRLTPAGQYTVLHAFGGNQANPVTGVVEVLQNDPTPSGSSTAPAQHYYLYGASELSSFVGLLFRLREDGNGSDFTVIENFNGADGAMPNVTPVLNRADLNLYGIAAAGGKFNAGVFYRLCNPRIVLTGGSVAASDGMVEVKVNVTGAQGGQTKENDFITIHVKLKNARIVQFLYRVAIVEGQRPIPGKVNCNYKYSYAAECTDYVPKIPYILKACTPDPVDPQVCYDLTTPPDAPAWIVDARRPSPFYASRLTLIDCDGNGLTIVDRPTFYPDPNDKITVLNYAQIFVAQDFVISESGQVIEEIDWSRVMPAAAKTAEYKNVSLIRLNPPQKLSWLQTRFSEALQGFNLNL